MPIFCPVFRHSPLLGSVLGAVLSLSSAGTVTAQPADTVSWSAPPAAITKGEKLKLTLNGSVLAGWHVYSLKQALEGPTPLLVTVDANEIASADGAVTESPAITFRDPAFGVDTHYYSDAFTLTVPVRLKAKLAAGQQTVPVSVRFQTCNGRICQPPKTVHLSAPVQVGG